MYAPTPEYTRDARKRGIEGTVDLQLTVTKKGTVKDVSVVKGLEPGLNKNAVGTVSKWKFRPAILAGLGWWYFYERQLTEYSPSYRD